MSSWLEVSLSVDGELAEAVAEVLARFAPNGVVTEQGIAFLDEEDQGTGAGPVAVRAYLPAGAELEGTRRALEEALYYLGMIQPLPAPSYREIADQNWMEAWKQHYRPIPIGERLIIVPAWLEPPQAGRVPIRIDPGMAFGTGTHPTTQLCLELIEAWFAERLAGGAAPRAPDVIDVGCGSGILSVAALKLGAGRALGLDVDPEAVRDARAHAEMNDVAERFSAVQGSVEQALEGGLPLRRADLVAANILAPVLERLLARGLGDLVAPGGRLLLSGILAEQAGAVERAAGEHGLGLVESRGSGDWVALAYARPAEGGRGR